MTAWEESASGLPRGFAARNDDFVVNRACHAETPTGRHCEQRTTDMSGENVDFHKSNSKNLPTYQVPDDYKFHVFKDKSDKLHIFGQIMTGRFTDDKCQVIVNENWQTMPFNLDYEPKMYMPQKPAQIENMLEIARLLFASIGVGYARVDLFLTTKIIVGEITFTPGGALAVQPQEWDGKLGALWA